MDLRNSRTATGSRNVNNRTGTNPYGDGAPHGDPAGLIQLAQMRLTAATHREAWSSGRNPARPPWTFLAALIANTKRPMYRTSSIPEERSQMEELLGMIRTILLNQEELKALISGLDMSVADLANRVSAMEAILANPEHPSILPCRRTLPLAVADDLLRPKARTQIGALFTPVTIPSLLSSLHCAAPPAALGPSLSPYLCQSTPQTFFSPFIILLILASRLLPQRPPFRSTLCRAIFTVKRDPSTRSLQFFGTPPALATTVAGPDGIFEMDTGLLLFDTPPALATAVAGPDGIFEIGTGLWLFNSPPALTTTVAGPNGIFEIAPRRAPALATAVAGPDGIFEIGTGLWLFNAPPALATAVAGPDGIFEKGTGFLHLDAPPALATAVAGPDGIFEMDTRLLLFDAPPALATAVAGPNGIFEIDTGFLHLDTPPALPVAITVFRHRIPQ
ncbi:hypothetical protein K438DRAFT_1956452 [Mycena galopus ATCC 62051]|nr:hypothetical protein K438DRAFT_1956452 [Mycena galopus ATCC 62051]